MWKSYRPLMVGLGVLFVSAGGGLAIAAPPSLETASLRAILKNLDESGVAPGAVVASPSRQDPNYFFHWVRDAALVMQPIVQKYARSSDAALEGRIWSWVRFEARLQETPNRSGGSGEPRFMVNGDADPSEWGRPQNDGPALRAISALKFARALLAKGRESDVRAELYGGGIPARGLIKRDLEFVAHHWQEASFDLWEEVKGSHFYTRMVQRRALIEGAELAESLNDLGAADFYRAQARLLETEIRSHVDSVSGLVRPTLNWVAGWTHKTSNLDIAVVLGSIHGVPEVASAGFKKDFFSPQSREILRSADALAQSFGALYPINTRALRSTPRSSANFAPAVASAVAPMIGRYPEDVYDGLSVNGQGNPWFISTHAMAELYCRSGDRAKGREFLARAASYVVGNAMAEQIHRATGRQQGARDLSWSYSSYLTAIDACR